MTRTRHSLPLLIGLCIFSALACSGSDATPASTSSGGHAAVGGAVSTGGSTNVSEGTLASGGAGTGGTSTSVATGGKGAGGVSHSGGTSTTSGPTATGGNHALGGTAPNGGVTSSAGSKANGGTSTVTTGGNKASGGSANGGTSVIASTGGAKATGGALATGGTKANAGSTATGGAATGGAAGGAKATGGSTAAGGINATGGSTGNISTAAVATTCPAAVPTGVTSSWCSCEQWGQWTSGNYTFYNDIWGSGAGAQCIWATSPNEWGVAANHPNTSGIKSYPNISLSPAKAISAINSYSSSFSVAVPSSGAHETTYDLWVKGTSSARIEIMLWMNYTGAVGPIASAYDSSGKAVADKTNVNVGGHTWNVYFGTNGSNDVVSLVRTSNTSSGTVDIKAILQWIIANNTTKYAVFTSSYTLDQAQFGFEITSDGTTHAFVVNSFSVTSS